MCYLAQPLPSFSGSAHECVCVCMGVCACAWVCVHAHAHACVHVDAYVCVHEHACACLCACVHALRWGKAVERGWALVVNDVLRALIKHIIIATNPLVWVI